MEISYLGFCEIFRIKIRAQASTFFSLRIFLYFIDIHILHEREKCTPFRSYISRAVNVGTELNVYGNLSKWGPPTMSFVLYTINVECRCDASYVTWKYRQYRRYHVIFARKYKSLQNVNILGARFNGNGTSFFLFNFLLVLFEKILYDICNELFTVIHFAWFF